ncbi:DeoR/GlpR transcriptional regulator [Xinfangfangia sp. D13-10-4-6]|uniref:DeoR/GlpR family DNA-binding transcription regulator n=1 Tax=Pseudogemmobacter hezensis TaxID=2737662 RepID=UPI001557F29D|nr:DeoR/GlpR family DNA-binding transcription regulator [Pseudogemmobacter hezensis]NPD16529.1 DeoR/GlpR transcriptional regulator [Pseudogemmobacter hezensis]
MTALSRRDEIAAMVIAKGEVRIDDLVQAFGVSRMTIHRHIEDLARQGVLRKLHGAVSAQPSGVYESHIAWRETHAAGAKAALARAALAEIQPGQAVILDDSTTVAALGPHLATIDPLTVITNSLGMMTRLSGPEGPELIALGGDYHPTYNAFIGHLCESALAGLHANLVICSASGATGVTALIQDARAVRVKQAMLKAAARRVLLLDHTKFGKLALHRFADLTDFDAVYVNRALADDTANALLAAGVPLILVDENE